MSGLLRSWIDSANAPGCQFPLNNLPYGVIDTGDVLKDPCVTAIGDQVLNLAPLIEEGLIVLRFQYSPDDALPLGMRILNGDWNSFMGFVDWAQFRSDLIELLIEGGNPALQEDDALRKRVFSLLKDAKLRMPFRLAEYTDFYSSRHHATNVGTMFRGAENALPPNWLHMPIGYNGRASSVVLSGTPVTRPRGQLKSAEHGAPAFLPSRRFDFELELGALVGRSSDAPLSVDEAYENIFGYLLLNDWSARDIQAWEYQPLGPFQAKATATSISPWIVTAAALEPFLVSAPDREMPLLPHLKDTGPMLYDIELEVGIKPEGGSETVITRTNYREMYYSSAQQLAHHSSSGCPMRTGDLLGSGTISGPTKDSRGSMLELSWGGKEPITLEGGENRSFIEDGDTIVMRGVAKGDGFRVGFGCCEGKLVPSK